MIPRSKSRGKPRGKLGGRGYGGPSRGGAGLRGPRRPVLERGRRLYRSRTQGPKGGSSRRDRPWCSAAAAAAAAIPLTRRPFLELLGGALRGRYSAAPGGSGGRWRGWGSAGGRWSLRRKFCVHASPEHWTRAPTLASPAPPSDPLTAALWPSVRPLSDCKDGALARGADGAFSAAAFFRGYARFPFFQCPLG